MTYSEDLVDSSEGISPTALEESDSVHALHFCGGVWSRVAFETPWRLLICQPLIIVFSESVCIGVLPDATLPI